MLIPVYDDSQGACRLVFVIAAFAETDQLPFDLGGRVGAGDRRTAVMAIVHYLTPNRYCR
jgi:hypothetical protein